MALLMQAEPIGDQLNTASSQKKPAREGWLLTSLGVEKDLLNHVSNR